MTLKTYRQLAYGDNLQEAFDTIVQDMKAQGLTEDQMEEYCATYLVPEMALLFAEAWMENQQDDPDDALVKFCRAEGITDEALYEAICEYIGEGTKADNVDTDFTKLTPQQHILAVRRFLRRLTGTLPAPDKTLLPTNRQNPSPAAKTRLPDNRNTDDDDDDYERPSNKLKAVVEEGIDDRHRHHHLHSLLKSWGYEHHTTHHIKQPDASVKAYHIWSNAHSNLVGSYEGERKWSSKISKNDGRTVHGVGKSELNDLLKNRAARYRAQEQVHLPANPLQEGLQNPFGVEKVKAYSEWMKQNPIRSLDHDVATNDAASRKNDLITAWRLKSEQDKTYGFDEDIDYRAGSHAQLNDRKTKK